MSVTIILYYMSNEHINCITYNSLNKKKVLWRHVKFIYKNIFPEIEENEKSPLDKSFFDLYIVSEENTI